MSEQLIQSLTATIGVAKTAERLLNSSSFDLASESFLLDHIDELTWLVLIKWIARERPEDASPRPVGRITTRIAASLAADDNFLLLTQLPAAVGCIEDGHVRTEVIAAVRPHLLDSDIWRFVVRRGSGDDIFAKIARLEDAIDQREVQIPHEFLSDGRIPSLSEHLFEAKHDHHACRAVLRQKAQSAELGCYTLWALRKTKLLATFDLDELLPNVRSRKEVPREEWNRTGFMLALASDWPDEERRRQWFIAFALGVAERGVPWTTLWWEIPADLRDDVALASRETDNIAPWAVPAIARRMSGQAAWDAVASVPDTSERHDINAGMDVAREVLGRRATHEEIQELVVDTDHQSHGVVVSEMPLPASPADDFDEVLLGLGKRFAWPAEIQIQLLRRLPATADRSKRVLSLALDAGGVWTMNDLEPLVEAAGRPDPDRVPLPPYLNQDMVARFRVLVGEQARTRLGVHLDHLLDEQDVLHALALADLEPELRTDSRVALLRRLVLALPVSEAAGIAESDSWLIAQADVVSRAESNDASWGRVEALPAYLKEPMIAAARNTSSARLAEQLLDRLEALGAARRQVLADAMRRLQQHGLEAVSPRWLAAKLTTRSLWEQPGVDFVTHYFMVGGRRGAQAVAQLCMANLMNEGTMALGRAHHEAVATGVLALIEGAFQAHQHDIVRAGLSALAHLNAPPRLRKRVTALRRFEPAADVITMIEANEALMRRSGKKDVALLDGVMAALSALAAPSLEESR